ncbi:SAM-dependent methyltransferase [Silvibacterium bohemicum]|uniref:SAM-dependent methyltransferase n=1 Tax=Silvibacterium bohemicum TaxID=1577686 RepID=A0A841K2Q3_9BACT|nr:class I SAM-dependent methyltransferase [Silvibacterium bohemicum]MBB6146209.1 SAM-dependent methyltransferase [Silvibacterium bohemicum]
MASSLPVIETFRDPAGSLRLEAGRARRRARIGRAAAALDFLATDLAQQWVSEGRLIATTRVATPTLHQDLQNDEVLLEHPRIFFPSYPWEWTPDAWIAAGNLTLDLCEGLLAKGLILKDATPLNILFQGAKPIFVDVLSIEKRDRESPLWLAYAQFVRTFLLPLIAHRTLGWPLAASFHRRDGYEPADIYPYLRARQRWQQPFRSLVTVPYLLEKRRSPEAAPARSGIRQSPEIAEAVLRRNLRNLRKLLNSLTPGNRKSRWSHYPQNAGHYSDEDHDQKQAFVRKALSLAKPQNVLDLGANTGVYSRLAASTGAKVVAWDTDTAASTRNFAQAQSENLPIQPLIADAARPTPPAGWRNAEYFSLLDRARRRFDCVLMLGLIHHLLIADQIPLGEIAGLLRDLTQRWIIVEWIPATDPRFVGLVRGREELYGHLDERSFLAAMETHFSIELQEVLANGRTLYLMQAVAQ